MAQLFGASWMCMLLAGVWSLACGYWLRRAWTAEGDQSHAAQLASARNESIRLRTEADTRGARVQTLEADLARQRDRIAEVESAKTTELEGMVKKLGGFEAKAAGFDLARVTSLKTVAERDRAITELNARLQSMDAALGEAHARVEQATAASAKAATELADDRRAWGIERSTLVDEHALKQAALDRSRGQAQVSQGSELAALKEQLHTASEHREAAVKRRDDDLSRLSTELRARIATLEAELMQTRRGAEPATPRKRDDLKVIEGIGPKIEMLLNEAGYLSFGDVALADPQALAQVLERAGPRFSLARTETWPQQAQLLADGKLDEFQKLTDALKGGVRR